MRKEATPGQKHRCDDYGLSVFPLYNSNCQKAVIKL